MVYLLRQNKKISINQIEENGWALYFTSKGNHDYMKAYEKFITIVR